MSQGATIIRFDPSQRGGDGGKGHGGQGPRGSRSGRFSVAALYTDSAPQQRPADDSGKLLRFEPRLQKDREGLATEYRLRLAPRNIAKVQLTLRSKREAWIDWVFVPPTYRGSGVARRLLDALCADADAAGASLGLEARACAGLDQAALEAWYGRFGFVATGEQGTFGPVLRRAPASAFRRAA
ncbi:MAG: GNAT family N-acetyltransferase [Planctomycetota bacterium]